MDQCPNCFEPLTYGSDGDESLVPRLLQCGHCVCSGCATDLIIDQGTHSSVYCPSCNHETLCSAPGAEYLPIAPASPILPYSGASKDDPVSLAERLHGSEGIDNRARSASSGSGGSWDSVGGSNLAAFMSTLSSPKVEDLAIVGNGGSGQEANPPKDTSNSCLVIGCDEERLKGSYVCKKHHSQGVKVSTKGAQAMVSKISGVSTYRLFVEGDELLHREEHQEPSLEHLRPDLLKDLFIEQKTLDEGTALYLIDKCTDMLRQEKNMLHIKAPVRIVGDLHGQFYDLMSIFNTHGSPYDDPKGQYLFLGDYVDRGDFSCEIVLYLLALKLACPDRMHLIRGNHECKSLTNHFGFKDECKAKYGKVVYNHFLLCFEAMPLCALVSNAHGEYFCTHGGISPELKELRQINEINRTMEPGMTGLMCDLMWADPADDPGIMGGAGEDLTPAEMETLINCDFQANELRGCSFKFGCRAARRFLEDNKLLTIIRAHAVQEEGYYRHFEFETDNPPQELEKLERARGMREKVKEKSRKGKDLMSSKTAGATDLDTGVGATVVSVHHDDEEERAENIRKSAAAGRAAEDVKGALEKSKAGGHVHGRPPALTASTASTATSSIASTSSSSLAAAPETETVAPDSPPSSFRALLTRVSHSFSFTRTSSFSFFDSAPTPAPAPDQEEVATALSPIPSPQPESPHPSPLSPVAPPQHAPTNTLPAVMTVFSAPNYCGRYGNKAAVLLITWADLEPEVNQYNCVPHPTVLERADRSKAHILALLDTCPYMPTSFRDFVRVAIKLGPAPPFEDPMDDGAQFREGGSGSPSARSRNSMSPSSKASSPSSAPPSPPSPRSPGDGSGHVGYAFDGGGGGLRRHERSQTVATVTTGSNGTGTSSPSPHALRSTQYTQQSPKSPPAASSTTVSLRPVSVTSPHRNGSGAVGSPSKRDGVNGGDQSDLFVSASSSALSTPFASGSVTMSPGSTRRLTGGVGSGDIINSNGGSGAVNGTGIRGRTGGGDGGSNGIGGGCGSSDIGDKDGNCYEAGVRTRSKSPSSRTSKTPNSSPPTTVLRGRKSPLSPPTTPHKGRKMTPHDLYEQQAAHDRLYELHPEKLDSITKELPMAVEVLAESREPFVENTFTLSVRELVGFFGIAVRGVGGVKGGVEQRPSDMGKPTKSVNEIRRMFEKKATDSTQAKADKADSVVNQMSKAIEAKTKKAQRRERKGSFIHDVKGSSSATEAPKTQASEAFKMFESMSKNKKQEEVARKLEMARKSRMNRAGRNSLLANNYLGSIKQRSASMDEDGSGSLGLPPSPSSAQMSQMRSASVSSSAGDSPATEGGGGGGLDLDDQAGGDFGVGRESLLEDPEREDEDRDDDDDDEGASNNGEGLGSRRLSHEQANGNGSERVDKAQDRGQVKQSAGEERGSEGVSGKLHVAVNAAGGGEGGEGGAPGPSSPAYIQPGEQTFSHAELLGLKLLFSLMDQRTCEYIDSAALESYAVEDDDVALTKEVQACIAAADADQDGHIGLMDFICFAARLKCCYERGWLSGL